MRIHGTSVALLLAACRTSHHGSGQVVETEQCAAPRPTDGFSPVDGNGPIDFVASAADEPLATNIYAALAQAYHGLERRTPETVDRDRNLIVFGRVDTNSIIGALAGPVTFERGRFRLGDHVYDDPDNGIAVLLPSPYAKGRFVVAYVGNSPSGLLLTQSVPTGEHQFTVVGSPIGVALEGDFCDGTYFAPYAVDRGRDWQAYRSALAHRDTPHHVIYFERGTKAERDIDAIARELDADYETTLRALAVPGLDRPIATYLWSSRDAKRRFTGDPGNGVAIGSTVHALYTEEVSALGPHEYVHVIASARLEGQPSPLWSEGLAVAVGKVWHDVPLADVVRELDASGQIPSLDKLLCCFRELDDNVSYPVAGHFVAFVIERFGIAKLKQLYAAPDPVSILPAVLGMDARALEAAWRATVRPR